MHFLSDLPGRDPLEVVRRFTPNWFAACMGTGILALMLDVFPYGGGLQTLAARGLWSFNVVFFLLSSLLFAGRALFYPRSFRLLFGHPVQSLYLGAIPMGMATIVNGLLLLWPPEEPFLVTAHVLWWLDVLLSVASVLLVPFFMFTSQHHSIEQMTGAWLLPVVPPEVAAASGGLLALHLPAIEAQDAVYVSYVLWSISVLLAMGILAILLLRLALHKLPHRDMAASAWLPLGPLGTGAMGMVTLGNADTAVFPERLHALAQFAQTGGVLVALLLWGFGLWWMAMALLFTLRYLREGLPFNMGWWGFTFPLGVFSAATYALAGKTGFWMFAPMATAFTVMLAFFWVLVTWKSFLGLWTGSLFQAPCLSPETGMLDPECNAPATVPAGEDFPGAHGKQH